MQIKIKISLKKRVLNQKKNIRNCPLRKSLWTKNNLKHIERENFKQATE